MVARYRVGPYRDQLELVTKAVTTLVWVVCQVVVAVW